jgi:hemin uptake protein HemP
MTENEQDDSGSRQLEQLRSASAAPMAGSVVRYVSSVDLFGGASEVVIEHAHHRYRLKMTSRGGLILNK